MQCPLGPGQEGGSGRPLAALSTQLARVAQAWLVCLTVFVLRGAAAWTKVLGAGGLAEFPAGSMELLVCQC